MATPISSPISTPPQLRDAINIGLVTTRRGILRPRRLLFDGVDDVHKCLYDNIENILCSPAKKAKKAKKIININNDEEICSICIDGMEQEYKVTKCGHLFHRECLFKWLENNVTCPLCRNKLL